ATVPGLIAYVKANPGKISLASFGSGTIAHAAGEMFKMTAGIQMVHVPYRGSAPMVTDLVSGQVLAAVGNLPASIRDIRTGKLRGLAVMSAPGGRPLPDVPPLSDFQPGFEANAWVGIAAPKGTPVEIIDRLNSEINAGLADPRITARIAGLGATVLSGSPAEFDRALVAQTDKWGKVIRGGKHQGGGWRPPARRHSLPLAAAVALLPATAQRATAQAFPSRPLRLLVGVTAGGANDTVARLLAQWLTERLGQQVVVE